MSFFRKHGVVNVKMVITEEKILSNIEKIQRLINPASKKQIIELEEDSYFKDLIDSIKTYLIEYPKKKNFPVGVYKSAYDLVEFATNQFEINTRAIEDLIKQREENIMLASNLKDLFDIVDAKEDKWADKIEENREKFSEDLIDTLSLIGRSKSNETENYQDGVKLVNAKISNLEKNLHIEIEMERIEDKSKALSYIGIEVAEALKQIPIPVNYIEYVEEQRFKDVLEVEEQKVEVEKVEENVNIQAVKEEAIQERSNSVQEYQVAGSLEDEFQQVSTFEVKKSLWQKFKETKFARAFSSIFRIRIVFDASNALPEGNNNNK